MTNDHQLCYKPKICEETELIELWLHGKGVGKGRPRFSRSGIVYTASRYRKWKNSAVLQLVAMKLPPAPIPAKIDCTFVNFFSSDVDNLCGSVLDSLVESGILQNDSSSYVVSCSGTFAKTRKRRREEKPVGILVGISQAQVEYLDLDIAAITPQSVA